MTPINASLFTRLLNLNTGNTPLEDFFTEIVAFFLDSNADLLVDFLKNLKVLDSIEYCNTCVSTQQTYSPLKHHKSSSRPDIVIELVGNRYKDIVFIESKIGSQEGDLQLQRYAEILDQIQGFRRKFLLFATRDFEPKEKSYVFQNLPNSSVEFYQFRWYQFYQFLRHHRNLAFVSEITLFMEEYNMAHNNQFSAIDVIALANFTKSLKMMEEVMWGEVSNKFSQVIGNVKQKSTSMTQISNFGRYIMFTFMPTWWCGLGFLLKTPDHIGYPSLGLILEVDPKSPHRPEIIEAMKEISAKYGWQQYEINNPKAWSRIIREKSLQDFLAEEDHIVAIQNFFLESLDELKQIKSEYPSLPWGVIEGSDTASDE